MKQPVDASLLNMGERWRMSLEGNPQLLCFGSDESRCSEGLALALVLGACLFVILVVIIGGCLKMKPE